jgi:hypothetical protein
VALNLQGLPMNAGHFKEKRIGLCVPAGSTDLAGLLDEHHC